MRTLDVHGSPNVGYDSQRIGRLAIGESTLIVLIDHSYRRAVASVMMDMPRNGGRVERRAAGTAFFVQYEYAWNASATYAVAPRHVVEAGELHGARGLFLRVADGAGVHDITMPAERWVPHPATDVTVARVEAPSGIDLHAYPQEALTYPKDRKGLAPVGEGDEVFFVSLFSHLSGQEHVLPIIRFGNIALMPYEPIKTKISAAKGAPEVAVTAYLVESRSWGGQSGSPAWVYFPASRFVTREEIAGSKPRLLGFVQAHYPIDPDEDLFFGDLAGTRALEPHAGIAIVVPTESIVEVLMSKKLQDERDALRAEHKARQPASAMHGIFKQAPVGEDVFERIEDLTRKLVKVPKSEVDKKRRKSSENAGEKTGKKASEKPGEKASGRAGGD